MGERIKMLTPEAHVAAAKESLSRITQFQITDETPPESFRDFLYEQGLGRQLCDIGQSFGEVSQNSAGYQQLHGSYDGRYMVGTYFPGEAPAFHAFFGPGGQHQETTAITFFEDGRPPMVQKSIPLDSYGRKKVVKLEDKPAEAWLEIRRLAELVAASLPAAEEAQTEYVLEQLAA